VPPVSDKVQVVVTDQPLAVYLLNTTDETINLESGELFGFNVGSFADKALGQGLFGDRSA